jgi:hypothetical protein
MRRYSTVKANVKKHVACFKNFSLFVNIMESARRHELDIFVSVCGYSSSHRFVSIHLGMKTIHSNASRLHRRIEDKVKYVSFLLLQFNNTC